LIDRTQKGAKFLSNGPIALSPQFQLFRGPSAIRSQKVACSEGVLYQRSQKGQVLWEQFKRYRTIQVTV
jgi:hypothetical protein